MDNYKNKLGSLADKLKQERPKTPIQEVQPVKVEIAKEVEAQFNNWIPKSLLKKIKAYGVENDQSLKDINIAALQLFLTTKAKLHKTITNAD
ncbi:MAG TPA: hypothetical protein VNW95_09575 [Mucilaginibacter sp.]|jgi:hypothetical protein|nr:hypothetical protein [Mucilaginibacter sp.]